MAHRPLRLILDGDALVANWRWLRERGGSAACGAAVKADGYGLGAHEVVKRLAAAGCRDFFVSTYAEAEALGAWDESLALSVLHGPGPDDTQAASASPARPVLNSPQQVARWREAGQGRPCDVMVDTGMNRLGLTPEESRSGLLDGLPIETLMSHLACADALDGTAPFAANTRQFSDFRTLTAQVPAQRYSLANSAGILLGTDYCFDLTRPGLGIYGGWARREAAEGIRAVASVEAQIVQLRIVREGQRIGYGGTFRADHATRIAVLNLGYADGYLRAVAEHGSAELGDVILPILGLVSMDLTAVAAPESLSVTEGDWIRLRFDLPMLAETLSQYELLTTLGSRFERVWA